MIRNAIPAQNPLERAREDHNLNTVKCYQYCIVKPCTGASLYLNPYNASLVCDLRINRFNTVITSVLHPLLANFKMPRN